MFSVSMEQNSCRSSAAKSFFCKTMTCSLYTKRNKSSVSTAHSKSLYGTFSTPLLFAGNAMLSPEKDTTNRPGFLNCSKLCGQYKKAPW